MCSEPIPGFRRLPSVDVIAGRSGSRAVAGSAVGIVAAVGLVDPSGLAPFGPVKWAALPAAVLILAAVTVDRAEVDRRTAAAWMAFLAIAAAASVNGLDPLYAWVGTPERRFGWLTWLLCAMAFAAGQQVHRRRAAGALGAALVVLCGLAGAVAMMELGGARPFGELAGASGRPGSVMGSSAFLGALAVLILPTAVVAALERRRPPVVRSAAAVAAALAGAALLASGARAAWLGGTVAAICGSAYAAKRRRDAAGETRRSVTLAFTVVTIGLLAATILVSSGAPARIRDAFTTERGGVQGRLDEWRVAGRVVVDRPLLGAGPEGYRIAFASAVDASYERAHGRDPLPDRAHSSLLDVAVTTGVPGLLAYAALLIVVGARIVRAVTDPRQQTAVVAFAVGVAGYLAQSLFLFPLAELDPLAWLLTGVVVAATQRPLDGVIGIRGPGRIARPAFALAAAIAAVVGVLDIAADRSARATLDAVADGVAPDAPDRAARLRPDAVRYRLVAVRGHERSVEPGSYAAILDQLDAARRLSPRDPVVRGERARVLLARAAATEAPDDIALALTALRDLAKDDPTNQHVRAQLSLANALANHQDDVGT